MNRKFFRTQFYLLVIFITFLTLSILLQDGLPFYENGIYVNYAQSILEDFDFNLINQVSDKQSWLVTSTFHYPDFHPTAQTPFIVLLSFFEKIASHIVGINFNNYFDYHLSSLTINLLISCFSFYFFIKLSKQYFGTEKKVPILVVTLGTVFLYFSFFAANVIDVLSVPFLSYVLYSINGIEKQNSKLKYFNFGMALGVISVLKTLYIPLVIFWLILVSYRLISIKKYSHFIFLFIVSLTPMFLNSVNTYIKCKQWFIEVSTGAKVLFDYSAEHIIKKLIYGYFGTSGFFSLNPTMLIGTLFFVLLVVANLKESPSKKVFSNTEGIAYLIFLGIIFFHPLFMLGEIVEDMLPGRACIPSLPFLMIGFSYISKTQQYQKYIKSLSIVLISWNIFIILNYLLISSVAVEYYYQSHFVFSFSQMGFLSNYLPSLKKNFNQLYYIFPKVIVFAFLINFIIMVIKILKIKFSINIKNYILIYWLISYVLMTSLNLNFSEKNVLAMKGMGTFENKVIGNGADIFLHDYLLDRFYTIDKSSKGILAPELKKRAILYYNKISPQIIKSTDEFEKKRKEADWSNSSIQ